MRKLASFIGFGEAAFHIAKGLSKNEGVCDIVAYDIMSNNDKIGPVIRKNSKEAGVTMLETMEEAIKASDFIFSLTSAKVALQIAQQVIPQLEAGQSFIDMNSASPMTKISIDEIPRKEGVLYCDASIMGPVPEKGHKVSMLLSGEGAQKFYGTFIKYGMNLENMNAKAGSSSAVKMIRSIFMKGLPQLMIECFVAAEYYGIMGKIVESLNETLSGKTVEKLANQLIPRTVVHAKRRSSEMADVISVLNKAGLDDSISVATKARLDKLVALHLVDGITPTTDYVETIKLILDANKKQA